MYRIGLDIGIASVGWAALQTDENGDPVRIINMGSRIFERAEEKDTGASLARPRRMARSARRTLRRKNHRKNRIKMLMEREGIISRENLEELYKDTSQLEDIYAVRARALDELLNNQELARLLVHYTQRRGFKSNRKNADESSDDGKLLKAVSANKTYMDEKGYRTVGEMLYKDEKFKTNKRNKREDYSNTFLRRQIKEEVDKVFKAQCILGSSLLSENFMEKYIEILFSQRDFSEGPGEGSPYGGNLIENMIGECSFEKGEPRAPKASYTFEKFNLWQKINNLSIVSRGTKCDLNPHEKEIVSGYCYETKDVTYTKLRKKLGMDENDLFGNISYGNKEISEVEKAKFQYLPAYHDMKSAFNKLSKDYIKNISDEKRDEIAYALTCFKTDEKITKYLEKGNLFTKEEMNVILSMKGGYTKFGNLSLKAMRKINPYLERGEKYDKACKSAGYDHRGHIGGEKQKYLPLLPDDTYEITSPVVKRAVRQTISVVNAIIKEYGRPIGVNIELAREMSKTKQERDKIKKEQESNAKNREDIIKKLQTEFNLLMPNSEDVLKYRLWKEQDCTCLYTSEPIEAERLFEEGYCEIDHIIPYSISFDDRYSNKVLVKTKANREKGNRLPLEYVKSRDDFIGLVHTFIKDKTKKRNLLKESFTEEEKHQWKERSLNDTKFISSFMYNYINDNLEFDKSYEGKKKVIAVNGMVTSYMRKRWGINKIRGNGDLHHAVDAVVVACITDGTINKVSRYAKIREGYYQPTEENKKFPLPWPHFRDELQARLSKDPIGELNHWNFAMYQDVDIEKIKPIFVSRRVKKKSTGPAHKGIITSLVEVNGTKYAVKKVSIKDLKLDKNNEIKNYYNKESDRPLYELLRDRLIAYDGKGDKAFPEGYVLKPAPKSGNSPKVYKVKTIEKSTLSVGVNGGIAGNGDMLRIDIFKIEGDGYYFVPIYVADLLKDTLPNKAVVRHKNYEDWKEMKNEDFLFSLYPNDLIKVVRKEDIKFKKSNKDSDLEEYYLTKEALVYYKGADITNGAITAILNDDSYEVKGLGVKTLISMEKYYVDVLGNVYKAGKETRKK